MSGWTLLLQVVNFVVLAWLLHRLLYKPVLALAAERQARIERAQADADRRAEEAEAMRGTLERRLAAVEGERDRVLAEGRATLAAEQQQARLQAREELAAAREAAHRQLEAEREAALAALQRQAAAVAERLARRLLAETGGADADARLAERVCERLEELPEHELEGLLDASTSPQPVTVASASPLPESFQARLRERLNARLERPLAVNFQRDEDLLAGVELRFAHGALGATWRDALTAAREEMAGGSQPR